MRLRLGKYIYAPIKIEKFDWLLIIGLTLAPMVALRVWKVGPGEVLCLLWGLKSLRRGKISSSNLSRFAVSFIAALLMGSLCGYIIAPEELDKFGVFTWIYLLGIAVLIFEGLRDNTLAYNEKLLSVFARVSAIWYLFLYVYSITVSRNLFGVSLWFGGGRFTGGGRNPHQVAVFFTGMSFVLLRKVLKKEDPITNLFLCLISWFLLWQTDSSTGKMSVAVGLFVMLYLNLIEAYPHQKFGLTVAMVSFAFVVVVLGFPIWMRLFLNWVGSDENGMGRFEIFATFPAAIIKSPIFGLGPGTHAVYGTYEFHNTYLDILAATGLVGVLIFAIHSLRVFRRVLKADWSLFPIVVTLYAYGLAGFAMRRLIYWGLMAFVLALAQQQGRSIVKK